MVLTGVSEAMTFETVRRSSFHPVIPFLLWGIVFVLAAELTARWIYASSGKVAQDYNADWKLREVTECFHPVLWEETWLRYRPGTSVEHASGAQASINLFGFRGSQPDFEARDALNIACLGGSTTVIGTTDGLTYPARLEQWLNRDASGKVFVLNAGVAGMDAGSYHHSFQRLKDAGAVPQVVVEYNAINSLCWQLIPYWRAQLRPWQRLFLRSQLVRYVWGRHFIPGEVKLRADIRSFCMGALQQLRSMLEEEGTQLAVASFCVPDPALGDGKQRMQLDYNARYWWRTDYISYRQLYRIVGIYNEELRAAFAGTDVWYLPLAEHAHMGPDAFLDICHMRQQGTDQMAFTLSQLLLPYLKLQD
jgi:hypothetical protein